jgi:thioredoxin-like negative regulator of GroEL
MAEPTERPTLLLFGAATDGPSRRVEAFLAQVLQRRHNHDTFAIRFVPADQRPDLVERFRVNEIPSLLLVVDKRVQGRLARPRGCVDIESFLAPWLKRTGRHNEPTVLAR